MTTDSSDPSRAVGDGEDGAPRADTDGHAPAASVGTRVRERIEAGQVDAVMLAVPTMAAALRGKSFDAHFAAQELLVQGGVAAMCAYLLTTAPDMTPVDGFMLASAESGWQDMQVAPDLSRAWGVPWAPRAVLVLGDALDEDGALIEVAPRQVLRAQVERLAEVGLHARAGLEYEAMVYEGTYAYYASLGAERPRRRLGHRNGDYNLVPDMRLADLLTDLHVGLRQTGLPVEAIKPEAGLAQIEITLRHADPLAAADDLAVYKWAVKALAERAGRAITFMAAPEPGVRVGNGGHMHLSLWHDNHDNALTTPDGPLSPLGRQVIAGILDTLGRWAPLWAPTVNSYRRFGARGEPFAPRRLDYGHDGRTTAVRIIGHGPHTRIEVRVPGADANPYLALAAVLAGVRHGIDHGLPLGRPLADDAPLLPVSLADALTVFEHDPVAADGFGKQVVEHYTAAAHAELRIHNGAGSDLEVTRWFADA